MAMPDDHVSPPVGGISFADHQRQIDAEREKRFEALRLADNLRLEQLRSADAAAVSAALAAAEKAVAIAEANAEKWRDNANEWRGAMQDREQKFALRDAMEAAIGNLAATVIAGDTALSTQINDLKATRSEGVGRTGLVDKAWATAGLIFVAVASVLSAVLSHVIK